MNEYTKRKLRTLAGVLLFLLFTALVIVGQRSISYGSLGLMMLGLAGILVLLYVYNRSFVKAKPVNLSPEDDPKGQKQP